MTDSLFQNDDQELPGPRGKAIGFLDSAINAGGLIVALTRLGIEDSRVEMFYGTADGQAWEEWMGASTWGETAEKVLKQGVAVLEEGGAIFAIRVADCPEAQQIATIAETHGAHTITYFGTLVDTVLTA